MGQEFPALKATLCSEPVLRRPGLKADFQLSTDWSQHGLGAVLSQIDEEGQEYAVAFASRSFNAAHKN